MNPLADVQHYSPELDPDGSVYMELDPDGRYVLAEDVLGEQERLAPLDVERLAKAIDRVWRDDGWEPTHPNSRQSHDEAERIAREYEAQR